MKLLVNTKTIQKSEFGSITGGLFFVFEGQYFPAEEWIDFPVVILGWWLGALADVLDGDSECKFGFMDGPYQIDIKRQGNNMCVLNCIRDTRNKEILFSNEVSLSEIINQVISAAKKTYKHCLEDNWVNDDLNELKVNLDQMLKRVFPYFTDILS